mgnify:CR=1 FL=1
MKKAWKMFWRTLASVFAMINNVAQAGEEYSRDLKEDATFGSEKSAHKREKKRAAWQAKQP